MKRLHNLTKILLVILAIMLASAISAQSQSTANARRTFSGNGAPSGACLMGPIWTDYYLNLTNGHFYYCSNPAGTWTDSNTTAGTGGGSNFTTQFVDSFNSASATPAGTFTGTWITGQGATNTKPHFLIEPTGTTSTAWNVNGTGIADNATSGFTGNLLDLQLNGVSKFSVTSTGTVAAGTAIFSGNSTANANISSAAGAFLWTGRSQILSPADGQVRFTNNAVSATATIIGTTTNDNAAATGIGEVITSTLATGSSVTLTTTTTATVTSISLTAGDWEVTGAVDFTFGATTSYTNLIGGSSTTAATIGGQDSAFDYETSAIVPTSGKDMTWVIPTTRYSLSGTTTVYLVAQGTFTVSTLKAYGTINARRMR